MIDYNRRRKEPESAAARQYGRIFERMAAHCLTISDPEERKLAARSAVDAMSVLFPAPQGVDRVTHRLKLWRGLAELTDYQLDVEMPFKIEKPVEALRRPDAVAPGSGHGRRREYGCHLELMLAEAAAMPEGEERKELVWLLANQMKKLLSAYDGEGIDDERIFRDIYDMTEGRIRLSSQDMKLRDYKVVAAPSGKKKKKNK